MATLKNGGKKYSATVSTLLQKAKQATSSAPRMLTASEKASLGQHARETSVMMRAMVKQGKAQSKQTQEVQ
ncbi:hypothetical protein Q6D67_09845 [Haliea sp. E1-2-M8]|uniref:hypothetical protein n=1 Tax=Haliea sp. E1-2-M8 TaxID=3064706 RepID=UPI0027204F26|nr:hypothetical protein [Haliea sp. E1-2-M8]MDO8862005.1 hypothetical protein [Haliea sp. E1-2-M8]